MRHVRDVPSPVRSLESRGCPLQVAENALDLKKEGRRREAEGPLLAPRSGFRAVVRIVAVAGLLVGGTAAAAPAPGFTAGDQVARAYDTILDANFARLPTRLAETCPPAPGEACLMLEALGVWWQISLDPAGRALDRAFVIKADRAIAAAEAWTRREPERAEAFFYLGAAYGARAQWRVLRGERLGAARDGARIKDALERALALDPDMHDAQFGIGLYRYYAATAPAALRMLRWLFLLPGGDRSSGLAQIHAAREHGTLVRSEADFQLHVIDLWYEARFADARQLIQDLQARHPQNPLFFFAAAEIADVYFHDPTSVLLIAEDLLLRARAGLVHEPVLAEARAHVLIAAALDRLDETDRAFEHLAWIAEHEPTRPAGIVAQAEALARSMRARLSRDPYRLGLEGWRAFERGELDLAARDLSAAVDRDPRDPVARYRYAQVLRATGDDPGARAALERALEHAGTGAPVIVAAAHFDLAEMAAGRGDRASALAHFEAAAATFGGDPRVIAAARREASALNERGSGRR